MTSKLRVLLIGFGKIASGYDADPLSRKYFEFISHFQAITSHPRLSLEAIVDPSDEARKSAESRGIRRVHASVEEVSNDDWDLVVLANPPKDRASAIQKLRSVRAVFSEKPLASSHEEARAILEACAQRRLPLQVNFWRRGDEVLRSLASGGLQERVGKIQTLVGYYGNGLRNNGSHLLDLILMQAGPIRRVLSASPYKTAVRYPIPGDRDVHAMVELQSGAIAHLLPLDFSQFRELGLDIWGTEGRLSMIHEGLDTMLAKATTHRSLTGAREIPWDQPRIERTGCSRALFELYCNLVRHLDQSEPLWSPGEQALQTEHWVTEILDRAGA